MRSRTVGKTLNSLLEPSAGFPTTSFDNFTGGLDMENSALAMYGCYNKRLARELFQVTDTHDVPSGVTLSCEVERAGG